MELPGNLFFFCNCIINGFLMFFFACQCWASGNCCTLDEYILDILQYFRMFTALNPFEKWPDCSSSQDHSNKQKRLKIYPEVAEKVWGVHTPLKSLLWERCEEYPRRFVLDCEFVARRGERLTLYLSQTGSFASFHAHSSSQLCCITDTCQEIAMTVLIVEHDRTSASYLISA